MLFKNGNVTVESSALLKKKKKKSLYVNVVCYCIDHTLCISVYDSTSLLSCSI